MDCLVFTALKASLRKDYTLDWPNPTICALSCFGRGQNFFEAFTTSFVHVSATAEGLSVSDLLTLVTSKLNPLKTLKNGGEQFMSRVAAGGILQGVALRLQ